MAAMAQEFTGALVGWHARAFDGRLVLHLQAVQKAPPHEREDVADLYFVLDRSQAVMLGNNLFSLAETTPPAPSPKGWLGKVLAR